MLEIQTDAGVKGVDMNEIVRIDRLRIFMDNLSGDVELDFDFLTADDEIDWTLNAKISYRTPKDLTDVPLARCYAVITARQLKDVMT